MPTRPTSPQPPASLTLEDAREALATLRCGRKGRAATLPNGWYLCLTWCGRRARYVLELLLGGGERFTWSVRREHLHVKPGRCRWRTDSLVTIAEEVIEEMAAKLFARLAHIEADYLPHMRLFRSWRIEAVRFRVLTDFDVVGVSGWQVRFAGQGWYTLACLGERDDVPALIARCEAMGRERFLSTDSEPGVALADITA